MNKISKVLVSVMIIVAIMSISVNVFATSTVLDSLETQVNTTANSTSSNEIVELGAKIINALTTAGIVLSVIVLIVLGLKYMIGSAEEKADYKKSFIPYLVGAVLIFAASTIASMVYNFI